jgi:ferredoxin
MKKAKVNKDKCLQCGGCVGVCPVGAITLIDGKGIVIDKNKCIGCGKCKLVCPVGAIEIVEEEDDKQ